MKFLHGQQKYFLLMLVFTFNLTSCYLFENCSEKETFYQFKCDGDIDCRTGDDEVNCTSIHSCPPNSFFCDLDKKCILTNSICDGIMDCSNGLDESTCLEPICTWYGCNCNITFLYEHDNSYCRPRKLCNEYDNLCDSTTIGHKCIDVPGGYKCQCIRGYFNYDDKTCVRLDYKDTKLMLLHCTNGTIMFNGLNDRTQVLYRIDSTNSTDCNRVRFDYNYGHDYIIWTVNYNRSSTGFIGKLFDRNLNTSELVTKLFHREEQIQQLTIDWVHDILYIATESCTLEAMSVKQPHQHYCLNYYGTNLDKVMFMAVSPINGFIIRANKFLVERMKQDGSEVMVTVNQTSDRFYSLAIDIDSQKSIFVTEGNMFPEPIHGYSNATIVHSTVFGDNLLMSFENRYFRYNKHVQGNQMKLFAKARCEFCKLVHPSIQPKGLNKCSNAKCEGLCLPNQMNYICLKRLEYKIDNYGNPLRTNRKWATNGRTEPVSTT